MSHRNLLDQPADAFSQTILSVGGTGLRELRHPVSAALPAQANEQFSRFKIRLATNDGQKRMARMLVQKMYATRGYETGGAATAEGIEAPNQLTLVVSDSKERPRGTMSMIFDTGQGLPADKIFRDLLHPLRQQGSRLIEIGRLAVDGAEGSKRLFAGMVHIFLIYATVIHRYTDWIIEVNPRHVRYYEKMLGMEVLSEVRQACGDGTAAVLMRIQLCAMLERAQALGGQGSMVAGERDLHHNFRLYRYFLCKEDAPGIAHRLLSEHWL